MSDRKWVRSFEGPRWATFDKYVGKRYEQHCYYIYETKDFFEIEICKNLFGDYSNKALVRNRHETTIECANANVAIVMAQTFLRNDERMVEKKNKIAFEEEIIILTVMRAGLYFADGFRFYFQKAPFYHINPIREIGISEKEFRGLPDLNCKTVVLIDAVINTGNTIIPVIHQIQKVTPKRIVVSCMVLPNGTAKGLIGEFPHIDFCFTRISNNAYVGKGPTDTGNRLFGTI